MASCVANVTASAPITPFAQVADVTNRRWYVVLGLARRTPATAVCRPCGTACERLGTPNTEATVTVNVVCPISAPSAIDTTSNE
jgi:hypothetical protein